MAASDSLPVPRKNTAYRAYFPILKGDGTLISGWTSPAATLSKDGATSASATNSPTEIATSWGIGYLDLTATEMNADAVIIKATVTNTGAMAQVIVLYPQEADDIRVNTTYVAGTSQTARDLGAQLDAAVSSRLAAASYTTPPTAVQNRQEMDSNSTRLAHLDVDISTRLADSDYTAPDNADIVLIKAKTDNLPDTPASTDDVTSAQETIIAHGDANWEGGSSSDPWATDIDDSYSGSEAGALLAEIFQKAMLISVDGVNFVGIVNPTLEEFAIVQGTDYTVDSGAILPEWSNADWSALDLPTATVIFRASTLQNNAVVFQKTMDVVDATHIRLPLTAAETGALTSDKTKPYFFQIVATLSNGKKNPLIPTGRMMVVAAI